MPQILSFSVDTEKETKKKSTQHLIIKELGNVVTIITSNTATYFVQGGLS